jgi:hypothetical protein
VRKILSEAHPSLESLSKPTSRLERLIYGWRNDPLFSSRKGKARDLEFRGSNSEFDDLVRKYGRDITKRAIRVQLLMLGFAQVRKGKLCLKNGAPKNKKTIAASADLRFVASQLANIDFELGRRAYSSRHIAVTASESKSVRAMRAIAISRLETVLNSLASMSTQRPALSMNRRTTSERLLISTTVAVEHEEGK